MAAVDPGPAPQDRPLAGLGRFSRKLALGTALAAAAAVLVLRLAGRPIDAGREAERQAEGAAARAAASAPVMPPSPSDATPVGETAREVERRYAAGELAEAQRRFAPCPGGDLRRVAWIEEQQRVRKLVRHRPGGLVLEEWFDEHGRVREALVRATAGGRSWVRQVTIDERGAETVVRATDGPAPDEPPPALVRGDPTSAFFSGAGCER